MFRWELEDLAREQLTGMPPQVQLVLSDFMDAVVIVDQPINLKEAHAGAIRLPGSHAPGIAAGQLHTEGNLEFNNGFTASAEICL